MRSPLVAVTVIGEAPKLQGSVSDQCPPESADGGGQRGRPAPAGIVSASTAAPGSVVPVTVALVPAVSGTSEVTVSANVPGMPCAT